MTDNVTPFPTQPAKREYTITYLEKPSNEADTATATATGYLVELGIFTGVSAVYGAQVLTEALVMVPTMSITHISSKEISTEH